MSLARRFLSNENGATATEYAVMLALIILAAVVAVQALGDNVANTFQGVVDGAE